ncbi:MAG TPA: DUF4350 domain-containing protein [Trebonia sp.]|jgi:hypothetical protein
MTAGVTEEAPQAGPPAETGTAETGTPRTGTAKGGTAPGGLGTSGTSRWRLPAVLGLCVIAAGVLIALLQPSSQSSGVLDPNSTGSDGAHALADLITSRGQHVDRVTVPLTSGAADNSQDLELVTSPGDLSSAELRQVAHFKGDILLIDPDAAVLDTVAPRVEYLGQEPGAVLAGPFCNFGPANLAGNADIDGAVVYPYGPGAQECYPGGSGYSLVQFPHGAQSVTILGARAPLTNQYLGEDGNAALSLNLLRNAPTVVWVVPVPGAVPPAQASQGGSGNTGSGGSEGSGQGSSSQNGSGAGGSNAGNGNGGSGNTGAGGSTERSFFSLVPWPAYLILIQLAVAVALAAVWRARRLGPLIAERLPVVVRASETVEGHGRLYQARRARDRAAAELRAAARDRISRLIGTEPDPRVLAARTEQDPDTITRLLGGPALETDADLVALAVDLDTLERKVRQQ